MRTYLDYIPELRQAFIDAGIDLEEPIGMAESIKGNKMIDDVDWFLTYGYGKYQHVVNS